MMKIIKKISIFLILIYAAGCDKKHLVEISFPINYSIEADPSVKSIQIDENMVNDINIFLYNQNGLLVDCGYTTSDNINLEIWENEEYRVYAIANIGNITSDRSLFNEDGIMNYSHQIADYTLMANSSGGVPMSYRSETFRKLSTEDEIEILLKRFVSSVNIKLDTSQMKNISNFNVKSVTLKNIPCVMKFFASSKAENISEILPSGDSKSASDLSEISSTGVSFYTLENMQGTLLSDNIEQSRKTFPQGSIHSSLCTYVELIIDYRSNTAYDENLPYRFYLGNNNYSNFDIQRNTKYDILITPRESGINEDSWRIDTSNLKYLVTGISISPSSHTFKTIGETLLLSPSVTPSYAENKVIKWSSSEINIASVSSTGEVKAVSDGICTITAQSTDGTLLHDDCIITVDSYVWPESITVFPNELSLFLGETKSLSASIIPDNSTSKKIIWSSSDEQIAKVSEAGAVTALAEGNCIIYASASDKPQVRGESALTVSPKQFTISPTSVTIYKGETYSMSYSAHPSGTPSWESTDNSIASVNNGIISGIKAGETTIKATCNGISRNCSVTVSNPVLSFSSNSVTIYEGMEHTLSLSKIAPYTAQVQWNSTDTEVASLVPASDGQSCIIKGSKRGNCTVSATANGLSVQCSVEIIPAIEIIPGNYLKLANYSLWPEMNNSELPSSAKFTIKKAPNASIRWIVKRQVENGRKDIYISDSGILTLGANASGQYSIQAKASTGEYYSNIVNMEIYYFLLFQDELFFVDGNWSEGNNSECDLIVSMGTRWYEDRKPEGYFVEMQNIELIFDENIEDADKVKPSLYTIGDTYLVNAKYYNIVFNQSFMHSAFYELPSRSYVYETKLNFGNKIKYRVTDGNRSYYFLKRMNGFYNDPTTP